MKNKVLKISVILLIILTMTMTNFIFVGSSLISYALDNNDKTNNSNIEFNTYFKDEAGEKIASLDILPSNDEAMLYVSINVKQEGYLNGTINLEDGSNFNLVECDNQYVESVENNTIKLHNITAGTSVEIPVKIKPIKEENYSIGFLDVESKMTLNGIYRDSSQRDKKIKATKTLKLQFVDELTQEDMINDTTIITNKVSNVNGEEKRVVQLSWNIGTKSNSYPIEEIKAKIKTPIVDEKEPQVETQVALNTMTDYNNKYENGVNQITFTNQKTQDGNITWKTSGTENIILTYLYDKDVQFNDIIVEPEVEIKLYNKKEMNHTSQMILNNEEKDAVVEVTTQNQENEIYKGKLVSGIERKYLTKTSVKVNLAKMINEMAIQENESTYTVEGTENPSNIFYSQTLIAKEQFDKILGENGSITIVNQMNQEIGKIDAQTPVNENGYMVINYGDSQTKAIKIQTTKPVAEGTLEINHEKNIKETQNEMVKTASRIHSVISFQYNQGMVNQVENNINLKDTITESKISVNTEQLSTVVGNHIEMKMTLLANQEKYDLYENPSFAITLPNQVENINITNISKLYDDNNVFGDTIQYAINGNTINLVLNGKQTNYTSTVEGITIVVEADVQVSKTAATSDEQITLTYQNANAVSYANNAVATTPIRVTAPKEITAVNSIRELAVETIGEEEKTEVMMEKGTSAKQVEANMEIINSNVSPIKDVKILGEFPTDNSQNNMGIAITRGIEVAGVDNAKVYYSANEEVTDDINNEQNGWSESLNGVQAKSYLILLDSVEAQSSIQANYQMEIPENLEYNKLATEGYAINATNSQTGTEIQISATTIAMQTGVGPKVESEIQAVVGTETLKENAVVKNGEVIKYQVKVSNTGTEDATNIVVVGNVPEGTTLVKPMKHYEYTGAAYYKEEPEAKSCTTTVESLKVGESKIAEYEVRVNKDVEAGATIKNETEVQYGEAKTKSTMTNVTEASNVRVSVKRVTDLSAGGVNVGDYITYFAIVDNMSDTEQRDVTIQTNLSDNAEVSYLTLITGMEIREVTDEDLEDADIDREREYNDIEEINESSTEEGDEVSTEEEILTYQKELNIGTLKGGETKVLCYVIKAKASDDINISVVSKVNDQISRSNLWGTAVSYYDIQADMKTNTESQFVKVGDEIDYIITATNKGTGKSSLLEIIDEIPDDLEILSITVNGEEKSIPETSNKVKIRTFVPAKENVDIIIKTLVNNNESTEAKTIKNLATIDDDTGEQIATTPEITHIIKGDSSGSNEEEDPDNPNNPGDDSNGGNQNTQGNNMIAGVAWLDSNSNGIKETGEPLLANITVKLLNVETNEIVKDNAGNEITDTTNSEGVYILQHVANGKYIVVFEYDTTKYGLTTYQANGASESQSSKAIMNELNINGSATKVASSDIITIDNKDISNINIGLIELKNFDLQLEKGISQILIQNASGSIVKKYDNVDMAKIELDAKKINGSTVLIQYSIKVSNVGELDGYVKKIVDYMPSDLKFSSELNKDWYQTNGLLYNASLANEKIAAGESKTVTLTLTKSMTENNTGLTTNSAEIAEDYNELGIKDSNSTPGNKATGENDMSSAEVIISIRTGAIFYISIVIAIIAIGIVVAFVIIKKKKQNDTEMII